MSRNEAETRSLKQNGGLSVSHFAPTGLEKIDDHLTQGFAHVLTYIRPTAWSAGAGINHLGLRIYGLD